MVKLQCSLTAQDCPQLFGPSSTLHKLPYTSQSCVKDPRLLGDVGRCGFPGAACVVDSLGNDNCAFGGDSTVAHYTPLCQNGFCGGGLGAVCVNGDYDCNWGYYCNTTYPTPGVCGGAGSFVSSQGDVNVDFAFDYCISGKATQSSTGSWYCDGEVAGVITTPTISSTDVVRTSTSSSSTSHIPSPTPPVPVNRHHTPTALIAGLSAGVVVVLILVIGFLVWWRWNTKRRLSNASNIAPDPQPFSSIPSPNNSGALEEKDFSGGMPAVYAAPAFSYLPEVQHDPNEAIRNLNHPTTALQTTPTSPGFAYTSSNPSPNPTPSPYTSTYGLPSLQGTAAGTSVQYDSSTNLDATERHLLAARIQADRELAMMQNDGR